MKLRVCALFVVLLVLCVCVCAFVGCDEDESAAPIDQIDKFEIRVSPNSDGTLNMSYEITWQVLLNSTEPLQDVYVGVPNRFVSGIVATSNNIDTIELSTGDESQIHLWLDRNYNAGDRLTFSFSFRQSRFFTLDGDRVTYYFIPGWFDEIAVKQIAVYWKAANVVYADGATQQGDYLVWTGSLAAGERFKKVNVAYDRSTFPDLVPSQDYSTETDDPMNFILVMVVMVIFVVSLVVLPYLVWRINDEGYYAHRGFGGRSYYNGAIIYHGRGVTRQGKKIQRYTPPSSGGSDGGHGGSCACACACACAGGGRAGCSRKDFACSADMATLEKFIDSDN